MATYHDLPAEMKDLIICEPITVCRLINKEMLHIKNVKVVKKINYIKRGLCNNYIKNAPLTMVHKCDVGSVLYKNGIFLKKLESDYTYTIISSDQEPFYWQQKVFNDYPEIDLLAVYTILLERESYRPGIAKENVFTILRRKVLYKYAPNHKVYYYVWLYTNAVILNIRDLDNIKTYGIDFMKECTLLHNEITEYFNKL